METATLVTKYGLLLPNRFCSVEKRGAGTQQCPPTHFLGSLLYPSIKDIPKKTTGGNLKVPTFLYIICKIRGQLDLCTKDKKGWVPSVSIIVRFHCHVLVSIIYVAYLIDIV